jgi:hypothetical protein
MERFFLQHDCRSSSKEMIIILPGNPSPEISTDFKADSQISAASPLFEFLPLRITPSDIPQGLAFA